MELGAQVRNRTVIDARHCLDASLWRDAGWTVHGFGRADSGEPESTAVRADLGAVAALAAS